MDTEQPLADSDAGIHERLTAAFAPEGPEETQREEAVETQEIATEEVVDDSVDFVDDDGQSYKIPKALEGKIHLRSDYTRKTTEAANLAKVAQDRIQYAEVREQFSEAISQKAAEVHSLKTEMKRLREMDVSQLDPSMMWRINQQCELLREQITEGERQIQGGRAQLQSIAQQHSERQWQLAVEGAKQRIGQFTPGEDSAMRKQVETLGFSENELKGRFADPRFLQLVHKAAKWDALQATKGKSLEAVKSAPPVLKPGASKPGAAQAQNYQDARAKLRKTGDVRDAAKLFLMRG